MVFSAVGSPPWCCSTRSSTSAAHSGGSTSAWPGHGGRRVRQHANGTFLTRHLEADRLKAARGWPKCSWTVVSFVVDDVRRHPQDLVMRVSRRLDAPRLAG